MYRIDKYIKDSIGKNLIDIQVDLQHEIAKAERGTSNVKGAVKKREMGALDYAENLKGLVWFLNTGIKPAGVNDIDFQLFKPLIEDLVDRNQLKEEILKRFR